MGNNTQTPSHDNPNPGGGQMPGQKQGGRTDEDENRRDPRQGGGRKDTGDDEDGGRNPPRSEPRPGEENR